MLFPSPDCQIDIHLNFVYFIHLFNFLFIYLFIYGLVFNLQWNPNHSLISLRSLANLPARYWIQEITLDEKHDNSHTGIVFKLSVNVLLDWLKITSPRN